MEFEGKVALVTGGSSGIGAAAVELLVARGARVFAVGRSAAKLAAVADRAGGNVVTHVADVGDQAQAEAMVEAAVAEFGRLDILMNNAGIGGVLKRVADVTPDDWRQIMAINLDSVFWASRIALPHLVASKGCIVNTSSLAGLAADYSMMPYNVSKHAVIALTQCMALDYAADGVRVNCVSPGYCVTSINGGLPPAMAQAYVDRVPMGRAAGTHEMAEAMLFLASPRASYISGHNLVVDGAVMATAGLPNLPAMFAQMAGE